MKNKVLFLIFLVNSCAVGQTLHRGHDRDVGTVTNVSEPQIQYQIFSADQISQLSSQGQALTDINVRLTSIEKSIDDIRGDLKSVKETDVIVRFLVVCIQIVVPGILIAAFSIWFADWNKRKKPSRARA
jgi:septation ring formation regulator EzrA